MRYLLKLVDKFFKIPFLRELNERKEIIGAILVIAVALDSAMLSVISQLPDYPVLIQIESVLSKVISGIGQLGELIGLPVFAAGALHRRVKEKVG